MPFNSDLYTAAATVIPVLFVALVLPNGILANYAIWCKKWRSKHVVPLFKSGDNERLWLAKNGYRLLYLPVDFVFLAGAWGEICAFIALARRHVTPLEAHVVLASVLGLPIVAAISASSMISQTWAAGIGKERNGAERSSGAQDRSLPFHEGVSKS